MAEEVADAADRRRGVERGTHFVMQERRVDFPQLAQDRLTGADDIAALTEGAFPQKRLLENAPCPIGKDDLSALYERSLSHHYGCG